MVQWWIFGTIAVVVLLLTILFTGPPGVFKARLLFIVTYMFTFASCVLPIVRRDLHFEKSHFEGGDGDRPGWCAESESDKGGKVRSGW